MERLAAPWITSAKTQAVFTALQRAGHRGYFVGGCVRDALIGRAVGDIDIATDAPPDVVIQACEAAGLRVVPTGVEHGTVTVLSRGRHFEVTTFRRDVATDGRRAVVAYSERMEEDAARRDFTMNALYADAAGTVIDPLGGMDDLRARRVRFIGDAAARIGEDYLRILRFFRFYAWLGDVAQGPDPAALAAIAAHLDGLARLSAERVTAEMLKLLAAPDPAPALAAMAQAGVLARVLPGAQAQSMAPLVHLEDGRHPDPVRRLAALGPETALDRLRLSKAQQRALAQLHQIIAADVSLEEAAYRHGAQATLDAVLVRHAMMGQALEPGLEQRLARAAGQRFPVRASDLQDQFSGPELGARLRALEAAWIGSGFALRREELLAL